MYDASLSSMWGMKNFAVFGDFLQAAARLGFAKVELNHQVSAGMLAGLNLDGYKISSIHEPCPAVIPANELKKRDLLISSPDEEHRRQGIDHVIRSIDLAGRLRCEAVVVHCGQIQADTGLESQLRTLFENGEDGSVGYTEMQDLFSCQRASLVGPYMEAVKKSLVALLEVAGRFHIRLGLENRFHFFDLPTLAEMAELLELAGPDRLGFVYDVGHAEVQERLFALPRRLWLDRFAGRLIGVHLHDVVGLHDHRAPGLGQVDFRELAAFMPSDVFRTIEITSSNTPDQIEAGMKILVDTGCVRLL